MRIEPASPDDRGALLDSWLRSFRTSHYAGLIPMDEWALVMTPIIEDLLDRSSLLVMRGTTFGTTYGWLAHEGRSLVHYVYVWNSYRFQAEEIVDALLAAADIRPRFFYSCRSSFVERMFRERVPRPKFNPLYARHGSTPEQRKKVRNGKTVPVTYSR